MVSCSEGKREEGRPSQELSFCSGQMLLVLVNNQSKEAETQGPHARRATAEMRSPSMAGGLPGQKGYSARLLHRVTATWCTQVRKEPVKLP